MYYTGDVADWCKITFGSTYANPLLYAGNLYMDGNLVTTVVIPKEASPVPSGAFYNATCIRSVHFSAGVDAVLKDAFAGCSNISKVTYSCAYSSADDILFASGNDYLINAVWSKDHDWNAGVVTTAPTTNAAGVKTYTCTATGCGATKTETIPSLAKPGDINGDGSVTTKDVTALRRAIAGGYGIEEADGMDVNGDGVITTKDVTSLRRYIAGGYGIEL